MDETTLDYLANLSQDQEGETLKDLMREHYDIFRPYLDSLFHVEANCIYLNLICGVPQTKIGEVLGISQYGVSKRVRGGLNKLIHLVKIPETNRVILRQDFETLLPRNKSEVLFLYYFLRTFALVSRIMRVDPNIINTMVLKSVEDLLRYSQCDNLKSFMVAYLETHEIKSPSLKALSVNHPDHFQFLDSLRSDGSKYEQLVIASARYYKYISGLLTYSSYGDYTFKLFDQKRTRE